MICISCLPIRSLTIIIADQGINHIHVQKFIDRFVEVCTSACFKNDFLWFMIALTKTRTYVFNAKIRFMVPGKMGVDMPIR